MTEEYKLSHFLRGHTKDVRCLAVSNELKLIVSGSRDKIAKLWIPDVNLSGYQNSVSFRGHNGFISSVCVIHEDPRYPHGLILTGSNDSNILGFIPDTPDPVLMLSGHTDSVCSLDSGKHGLFVSGSWDHTAKVWLNENCLMTLTGHSLAVWCVKVVPGEGQILTASADKTIKLWKAGACLRTFTGHSDCVRGLALVSLTEFLSCSNDASIRLWNTSGDSLKVFYGHENFIYSIARISDDKFVSSSEDGTLKVWKGGQCSQTVSLPCQSVWCVEAMENGDIIAGCSNGSLYVFSPDVTRAASIETMKEFEEELIHFTKAHSGEIGDLKLSELPGEEALGEEGKSDGQTKMIREGTKAILYSWSQADKTWTKVGDVVGASGGGQNNKQLYDGKEYDYVFSVDVEEGKPALKLPYNKGEDPWLAAQSFIHKHDLSQFYLDQVANFIVTNSSQEPGVTSASSKNFADPFTGGNRYIPGGARNQDPIDETAKVSYFPVKHYLSLDTINLQLTFNKLAEFNSLSPNPVQPEDLNSINDLLKGQCNGGQKVMDPLWYLLSWPPEQLLPVLDVWRMVVKIPEVINLILGQRPDSLKETCCGVLSSDHQVNKMLVLRLICNLFHVAKGRQFVVGLTDKIFTSLVQSLPSDNKHLEIAAISVLVNFSYLVYSGEGEGLNADFQDALVARLAVLLPLLQTSEAQYRCLVALGTVCSKDNHTVQLCKSLQLTEAIVKYTTVREPSKLQACALGLLRLLQ